MGRAGLGFGILMTIAGCGTETYVGDPPEASYTYFQDAKPVLDARCVECHEDGESIPLGTYREAYLFRDVLAESVLDGTMPPEEDDETDALHDEELRALVGWVEQGALMGSPNDAAVEE